MTVILHSEFATPIMEKNEKYFFSRKENKFITSLPTKLNISSGNAITLNRFVLDHEELKKFKSFVQEALDYYAYAILECKKSMKFYITESWFNYNKPGTSHHAHWHPNSIISGVYCLKGSSTPLILSRREHLFPGFMFNYQRSNKCTNLERSFLLKEGSFIIFPSASFHYVPINNSSQVRKTLSFNTFVKGKIGQLHSELNL